jgi:DNA-directed RNA polymerase subunit RPC12/RpoP
MICWRCNYNNEEIPVDFLGDFVCEKCEILNSIYPHPEMIKCSWCFAEVEETAETCPNCGSKVQKKGLDTTPQSNPGGVLTVENQQSPQEAGKDTQKARRG